MTKIHGDENSLNSRPYTNVHTSTTDNGEYPLLFQRPKIPQDANVRLQVLSQQ